ncbi:MAG: DUF4129 domain-containing protein [Nitrospirota bacterium]
MNRKVQRRKGKPAVELIEEAVHLLRRSAGRLLTPYYAGSLPFLLGFLYFWADMSRGANAWQHGAGEAFFVSALFIWMKCWHTVFARRIREQLTGEPTRPWTIRSALRMATLQTAIQPTGLVLLPLALIITLPFGWLYAFYQNITVFGDGETGGVRAIFRKARVTAALFPAQNHAALAILFLFGFFVFLNLTMVLAILPRLLHMLFGVETVFTRAGGSVFNTTFLAVTCGLSYLAVDPLVKAVYALRCFYGESLKTGEDLREELKRFRPATITAAVLAFLLFLHALTPSYASAGEQVAQNPVRHSPKVSAQEIDRSISKVITKREYSWRMPREKQGTEKKQGAIARFVDSAIEMVKDWLRPIGQWFKKAIDWIFDKFSRMRPDHEERPRDAGWSLSIYILLYALLCAAVCTLAIMFRRMWQRRRGSRVETAVGTAISAPDLERDDVPADQLPMDRWLELGRGLMEQGELRLALRAFYLAALSHLAAQGSITIASFKSNREYEQELRRKAHTLPELLQAFSENIRIVERAWYGMHEVTGDIMALFDTNQKRIMARAETTKLS